MKSIGGFECFCFVLFFLKPMSVAPCVKMIEEPLDSA